MTREKRLADLLLSCFNTDELRRWLAGREATEHLRNVVSFQNAPAKVATDVADALSEHGLADDAFFADLLAERPRRAKDIGPVQVAWSAPPAQKDSPGPAPVPVMPAKPSTGPVRILHLSDLHASDTTEWDAGPLLARLEDAVRELRKEGLGPDLIAITGDVARSGKAKEYVQVAKWLTENLLPAAGLGPQALLVVPGNHDVDRSQCSSAMVVGLDRQLREGKANAVASVRRDPKQLSVLHARYKAYLAFLKKLGVAHPADPTWTWKTTVRNVSVRFAGLDTAWLASKDDLKGQLILGLDAVNAAIPARRDTDLVVALAHHPLSWLTEWDAADVTKPLQARADLLLRGHLHDAAWNLIQGPQHQLIELPAGACYQGSGFPNSFQLIELDPANHALRAHLRAWSADHDGWVADGMRLPPNGVARMPLKVGR